MDRTHHRERERHYLGSARHHVPCWAKAAADKVLGGVLKAAEPLSRPDLGGNRTEKVEREARRWEEI